MITENGIVIEEKGDEAVVEVKRTGACSCCAAKGACATFGGASDAHVSVKNDIGAKPGNTVEIGIEETSLLVASFFVYLMPIAALFGGAVVGSMIFGGSSGGIPALFGLGGLVIGLFLVFLVDPHLKKKKNMRPHIVRIIERNER